MNALFPKNESGVERGFRVVVGLALLLLVFAGPKTPWGLVGVVPLLTGLVGTCPLYTALGVSTRRTKSGASD